MAGFIHAHVVEGTRIKVAITSDQGATLSLVGDATDLVPDVELDGVLAANPALRTNLWAHAKTWFAAHTLPNDQALREPEPDTQKAALKQLEELRTDTLKRSNEFATTAQWIADVADDLSLLDVRHDWCSSCFASTEHRKSNRPVGHMPVFVCQGCGSPTLPCAAAGCTNMAIRSRGAITVPQFCAEHRHEIPGFEKAQGSFGELHDYEEFLKYEKPNLDRTIKIASVGVLAVGVAAPLALLAAPAIGGAIGSLGVFGGFSGAAASSHGLALLGGGSLAAGGLGMAGGAAVVTAVGGAVGGALGASISNAYLREDKSFRIELLRPGKGGVPVLVANGFLSEGQSDKWGDWKEIVDRRYPDSPVYRVWWGAKELSDFGAAFASGASKAGGMAIIKAAAAFGTKAGAKLLGNVVTPALVATDIVKNPWHLAKSRADKTGVIVGDLLARTDAKSYVLIGHSLGARMMVVAAEELGTKPDGPRIEAAHLLGAAIGAKGEWDELTAAVDDAVYCYHSSNDTVLNIVYRTAQLGETAAGLTGFKPDASKIRNIDVSDTVGSHFDYQSQVELL